MPTNLIDKQGKIRRDSRFTQIDLFHINDRFTKALENSKISLSMENKSKNRQNQRKSSSVFSYLCLIFESGSPK